METKQIAAALVKAQKAFGPALKTHTNPAFKSKYADLAACVEAVIDGLNQNDIALTQEVDPHDRGVMVRTRLIHASGEEMTFGWMFVPAVKQDAPGFGSALTYARRYSLMAAVGQAPVDDDGNAAARASAKGKRIDLDVRPTSGAGDHIPEDEKVSIKEFAATIKEADEETYDRVLAYGLENEQLVYLWSLLPPNIKSGLKKVGAARDKP